MFSIEQIFSGRLFQIPDYQRGFAWEVPNCEELMDDIELLPEKFDHYFGTLVLKPNNTTEQDLEGKSYKGYDVVDGQQRLTAVSILLTVIQAEMRNIDAFKTMADGLQKNYIHANRLTDKGFLYKLTLNNDCKTFFRNNIITGKTDLTGAIILSHQRLFDAKKYYLGYFNKKAEELNAHYDEWLLNIHNKVTQKLKLSLYMVEHAIEVGVIFEVMNNRGKPLTELEKVKNYLLYLASKLTVATRNELADEINTTWSSIFEGFMSAGLGAESENQLLRAHWLMAYNYNKKEWKGSKSVKAKFNLKNYQGKHLELYNQIKEYVRTLKESSIAYSDSENPESKSSFNSFLHHPEMKAVRKFSIKLKRTRTLATFRPLLLACRLRFVNDADKYAQISELLEKFAFRVYSIEEKRADTGQTSLYKIAFQLFNAQISFDGAVDEIKKTLSYHSSDHKFRQFWKFDEEDNIWYGWRALKYFLYEYEEYSAKSGHVQYSWDYFNAKQLEDTIEHILPQTPKSAYWRDNFDKRNRKIYTHDLGNLCLTLNNSSYSNKDFPVKKGKPGQETPCYANSSLFQERALVTFRHWTVKAVERRRKMLTDWALNRWFVDLPKPTNSLPDEDLLDEVLLEENGNGETANE